MLALALCIAAAAGCGGSSATKTVDREPGPELKLPGGPPPKKLVVKDLKIGHGQPAKVGDTVAIEYIGKLWTGGSYSDSWTYDTIPHFIVGSHEPRLIAGFDRGIRGMKVGGRRLLYVPRSLDYLPGAHVTAGSGPLAFLVYMLRVVPPR